MNQIIDIVEEGKNLAILIQKGDEYFIEYVPADEGVGAVPSGIDISSRPLDIPEGFHPSGLGVHDNEACAIGIFEQEPDPGEPEEQAPSELPSDDPFGLILLDYESPLNLTDSPARLTEDGLQMLEGSGVLVYESVTGDSANSMILRPATDEGDHLSVVDVALDDERHLIQAPAQLTGSGKLVKGVDGQTFVGVDSADGLLVWAMGQLGVWELLPVVEGANSGSLCISEADGLLVWNSDQDFSRLLRWEDESWTPVTSGSSVAVNTAAIPGAKRQWMMDSADGGIEIVDEKGLESGPEVLPAVSSGGWCRGKLVDIKTASQLDGPTLRHRKARPPVGKRTSFEDARWSGEFNGGFLELCNRWSSNVQWHFRNNSPYDKDVMVIDWFGTVGTKACHRESSSHNRARGFDLAGIRFTNGYRLDCNNAHRKDALTVYQMRYIGVWASLRRKFCTVLTAPYGPVDHTDHIHFDNRTRLAPIRTRAETDTKMVQAACNLLNGENLVVDGGWGGLTQRAYERLLNDFKPLLSTLRTKDPKQSLDAADSFLLGIQAHGISNSRVGEWPGYKN